MRPLVNVSMHVSQSDPRVIVDFVLEFNTDEPIRSLHAILLWLGWSLMLNRINTISSAGKMLWG